MNAWVLAVRPKTLTATVAPVLVGTALVWVYAQKINLLVTLALFLSPIFIQIGTNFFNDAFDFKKGADTKDRLGPIRVTQIGLLSEKQVFAGGILCFLIATFFGLFLVQAGGWVILVIGLVCLISGYAYTGGPYPFAYIGLADLMVILFFGIVAVGGTYYVHLGQWPVAALVAGLQIGLLATGLLAINNLRDIESDRRANKKTLAVRFGKTFARAEIAFVMLMPFFLGLYWSNQGYFWGGFLPFFVLPLAISLVKSVYKTEPSGEYNKFLGRAALLELLFGIFLSGGFLLHS